jgi:hypothetical protein
MKCYSFVSLITVVLFVPVAYAMEQAKPITPDSFTKQGKEYMGYSIELFVQASKESKIVHGLAAIFNRLECDGVERLIHDSIILEKANTGLLKVQNDSVFQALYGLQNIGTFDYDGAKQLRADISRVVTQAVLANILRADCPRFNFPSKDLLAMFASFGPDSVKHNVELLKLNQSLDEASDTPSIAAMLLIATYLAQTGMGR